MSPEQFESGFNRTVVELKYAKFQLKGNYGSALIVP